MRTLTLYDLTGIQPFLFGARRLRANLGASWLAHVALSSEPEGWLGAAAQRVRATVLWSGGGNAVVSSPDASSARQLATQLSLRMLEEAPGLGLVCAHQAWDGEEASYHKVTRALRDAIEISKAARVGSACFTGGGVCEPCRDTGEPACTFAQDDGKPPIGASIDRRERACSKARDRLENFFKLPQGLDWTDDIDSLGRTSGEESALGVVHLDGNGMGAHFAQAARQGLGPVVALSRRVHAAGLGALRAGIQWVTERIEQGKLGFELSPQDTGGAPTKRLFPVRPVVFGGDDITLLCDGRIAIDLAAIMLEAWHNESQFHASAGVAIVRAHFPFYRAVEHAHTLCKKAKRWRKNQLVADASVLDWSLHREGGLATQPPVYTARPFVVVGPSPKEKPWRQWSWFRRECVQKLKDQTSLHTQIVSLAPALTAGRDPARRALSRLLDRHDYRLPTPPHHQLDVSGFEADETPYLDALEILDLVPREPL